MAKNPLSQWTMAIAANMTPATPAAASGVTNPAANAKPAANSVPPSSQAYALPGRNPRDSRKPAVPARPWPPNQPNSFWAPWAARMPPTARRMSSRAMSITPPFVLSFAPVVDGGADGRRHRLSRRGPRASRRSPPSPAVGGEGVGDAAMHRHQVMDPGLGEDAHHAVAAGDHVHPARIGGHHPDQVPQRVGRGA